MLLCAWASTNLEGEPEVRTVLFASGTILSYFQSAFVPIAAFPASQAPLWKISSKLYLTFVLVAMTIFIGIHFAFKWESKRKADIKEKTVEEWVDANSSTQAVELFQDYKVDN